MHVTELCPSPHLEAAEIGDDIGASKIVTISGVAIKIVGAEQVEKGVLYFKEFSRGMVINRTNSGTIAGLYGSDTDSWMGKRITLYRSETTFKNKTVACIRVKDSIPKPIDEPVEPPARKVRR